MGEGIMALGFYMYGGIYTCYSGKEVDNIAVNYYESLPDDQKLEYKFKNWERVFDVSLTDNSRWYMRGETVQATFWYLKKEYVRKVKFCRTAKREIGRWTNQGGNSS